MRSSEIPFMNGAGEPIPGFAIMTAGGTHLVDNQLVLVMQQPSESYDRLYYVNSPVPVSPGGFGTCNVGDHALARWNDSIAWTAGTTCGPKPGDWGLWSGSPGFHILGAATPGQLLVRQHEVTVLQGKTAATLEAGGSVTVNICNQDTDLGFRVVAYDWMLTAGYEIGAGDPVVVAWVNSAWVVIAAG
jgi:hypothetical protein